MKVTALLVGRQKRYRHFAARANFAFEALADISQGEVWAEMRAEFG
jgi:hypothetical protein